MNSFGKILTLSLAAAGLIIVAGCAREQAAGKKAEPVREITVYDARAFFETTSYWMSEAAGYAFSPDGADILVSSDAGGIYNVEALPAAGGPPEPLTNEKDSTFAISWFPNDRRILFSHDNGGDELDHVYVREEDGTRRDLTPGDKVKASFLGWSGDGATFFLLTNERDPKFFDLYRYDTSDYQRALVFQNDQGWSPDAISSDGRYLALTRPRTSADSDVFIVDLSAEGAAPVQVTPHEGNIAYGVFGFTPDNKRLVYSTDEFGEFTQAWTYDLASGEKAKLIGENWDVLYVIYSPSGRYRVWAINEDARTTVRIFDEKAGVMVTTLDLPKGKLASVRFNRDEGEIAFLLSSDTSPYNVMIANLRSGSVKQLTNALNPAIDEHDLVEASIKRYKSFDGLEIPGVLYRPHGASADHPAPALVWVHGGPGGQSRAGYSPTIQHLVNHGYAVFAANNRGSSGYGKTFFHMDDRKQGDVDLQDIVYAKKWLAEQDWVDSDEIGIIGGSYGGYMVGAALAFQPDVFKVGIDIFGVMNWLRTLESIPPWWAAFREALYDEMGDPATDSERLRRISPLFHAENIKVPLLVVQGVNDPRVLKAESDEIVAAVKANGVPVEYIVFDDEGHGFTKRKNRIAASEAYVKFLDRYLRGEEERAD